jgi:hypothetical protein
VIPRRRIPLCSVCQEYTHYKAAEDGIADMFGVKVKISKGDPVCLDHGLVTERGQTMLIEERVVA